MIRANGDLMRTDNVMARADYNMRAADAAKADTELSCHVGSSRSAVSNKLEGMPT